MEEFARHPHLWIRVDLEDDGSFWVVGGMIRTVITRHLAEDLRSAWADIEGPRIRPGPERTIAMELDAGIQDL